jgi:hypothetical protein
VAEIEEDSDDGFDWDGDDSESDRASNSDPFAAEEVKESKPREVRRTLTFLGSVSLPGRKLRLLSRPSDNDSGDQTFKLGTKEGLVNAGVGEGKAGAGGREGATSPKVPLVSDTGFSHLIVTGSMALHISPLATLPFAVLDGAGGKMAPVKEKTAEELEAAKPKSCFATAAVRVRPMSVAERKAGARDGILRVESAGGKGGDGEDAAAGGKKKKTKKKGRLGKMMSSLTKKVTGKKEVDPSRSAVLSIGDPIAPEARQHVTFNGGSFGADVDNMAVAQALLPQLVGPLWTEGHNCVLLGLGAKGTGKTFTLFGDGDEEEGIVQSVFDDVFERVKAFAKPKTVLGGLGGLFGRNKKKAKKGAGGGGGGGGGDGGVEGVGPLIEMSMFALYNEDVLDLVHPPRLQRRVSDVDILTSKTVPPPPEVTVRSFDLLCECVVFVVFSSSLYSLAHHHPLTTPTSTPDHLQPYSLARHVDVW